MPRRDVHDCSRGAVVLSLLALVVAFTAFFRRDLPRRAGLVTALAGGGAVALVLLQFMGAASTPGLTSRASPTRAD